MYGDILQLFQKNSNCPTQTQQNGLLSFSWTYTEKEENKKVLVVIQGVY